MASKFKCFFCFQIFLYQGSNSSSGFYTASRIQALYFCENFLYEFLYHRRTTGISLNGLFQKVYKFYKSHMELQKELQTQASTIYKCSSLFLQDSVKSKYIHWRAEWIYMCSCNTITLTSPHIWGVLLQSKEYYIIPFELCSIICNITEVQQ